MTLHDRLQQRAGRVPPGDPGEVLAAARERAAAGRPARNPKGVLAAAAVTAVALAAGALALASGSDEPATVAGPGGGAQQVECGGIPFDLAGLPGAPPASSLPEGPAGAVDDVGAPAFDPSQDWKVVFESDEQVRLVRELDEPVDDGRGATRTHEAVALTLITGASNVPDGWMRTSAGACTLRVLASGGLEAADLSLASAPSPAATTLDLLVRERDCASGRPADGRVEVIELVETAEQVRLRVGVRPLGGDQSCQDNPLTPFPVELTKPLGDREVVDSSIVPPRALTADSRD